MKKFINNIRNFIRDARVIVDPVDFLGSIRLLIFYRKIFKKYTMLKRGRIKAIYNLVKGLDKNNIEGDIVECGTWNGGSAAVMFLAHRRKTRNFHLFDSFSGLPEPSDKDSDEVRKIYKKGWLTADKKNVIDVMKMAGCSPNNFTVYEGLFENTIYECKVKDIAFLSVDADLYESVRQCLEHFYPSVVDGGVVYVDDYGASMWAGAKKATDEFIEKNNIHVNVESIDNSGSFFRKPGNT